MVKTLGRAVYGVEASTITVEVNWMATGTNYLIVGLPGSAIKESMQRVESAIQSKGYSKPRTRIVINLNLPISEKADLLLIFPLQSDY